MVLARVLFSVAMSRKQQFQSIPEMKGWFALCLCTYNVWYTGASTLRFFMKCVVRKVYY